MHSLVNISKSQAKVGKIHRIMLVPKRRFAYGYYDVLAGIYPKMVEIDLLVYLITSATSSKQAQHLVN